MLLKSEKVHLLPKCYPVFDNNLDLMLSSYPSEYDSCHQSVSQLSSLLYSFLMNQRMALLNPLLHLNIKVCLTRQLNQTKSLLKVDFCGILQGCSANFDKKCIKQSRVPELNRLIPRSAEEICSDFNSVKQKASSSCCSSPVSSTAY